MVRLGKWGFVPNLPSQYGERFGVEAIGTAVRRRSWRGPTLFLPRHSLPDFPTRLSCEIRTGGRVAACELVT